MNQEERNKLQEAEKEAAEIITIVNKNVNFTDSPPDVSFKTLMDTLAVIRVNVRYLLFDTEANRREKEELIKQLKESGD